MAKPARQTNGTWTLCVQFEGKRRNLTIGRVSAREAETFAHYVGDLVEYAKFGDRSLPPRLHAWLLDLGQKHKSQLSEIGLFEYHDGGLTIAELLDKYLEDYESRSDVAKSTIRKVRSTIKNRVYRLAGVDLKTVEPYQRNLRKNAEPQWSDEAKKLLTDFNSWQRNHFSVATWTRDNKLLSSVGIWAVKHGYCDYNPFSILPTGSMVNEERNQYLTREMVLDAMDSTLSPDIRLTLAMGRFAGLRTCSEVRTMKWSHVNPLAGTLTIIDSKTKKPRIMPLFDDIREELDRQREFTGETRWVASSEMRSTSSAANFDQCRDAVIRSGQVPWHRLRQNLRASCENDLLELFDERLVTEWVGHSVRVSREHYQKLRPSDYLNAIAKAADNQS